VTETTSPILSVDFEMAGLGNQTPFLPLPQNRGNTGHSSAEFFK